PTESYLELDEFSNYAYESVWYDIRAKLSSEFDDVCGDTFCEGDYTNLTPLRLNCSVTSKLGTIRDCAWVFAGSMEEIDPTTGTLAVDGPTYQCHFQPKPSVAKLTELLSASGSPIHETLPGMPGSIYDSLIDCFDHPIGQTTIAISDESEPKYVEPLVYFT